MYAVHEQLFEQVLSDVAPIGEYLSEHFVMEGLVLEGLAVVHIALCNEEIDDLPPFVDDDMELEPKEPSHAAPAFFRYSFEYLVLFFPFAMAYLYQSGIHKRDSRTLAQTAHLQKQYHRNYGFLLKFHKTIVGYRMGKVVFHMFTHVLQIKMFKAAVSLLMEKHHNGDHLALRHFTGSIAPFLFRTIIDSVFVKNLIQFYAKIVDKTKNFSNFIGRNHKRIIG